MRLEKATAVLNLARRLASSADGLTLDEIAESANVGRRTAERMRDAVEAVFGPLEWIDDGRKKRFRIIARGLGNFAVAPTAEELAELENAARVYDKKKDPLRASILRSLSIKVNSSLRDADRRRLSTDVDALVRAESLARQVGPRPYANPQILSSIRQALLSQVIISFQYAVEEGGARLRTVIPYGLIFAARYYLVGCLKTKNDPVLFRLDRIKNIKITEEYGAPPVDFNLDDYANRSFAVYQEAPEHVVLKFKSEVANDARAYIFHPTQNIVSEDDGSLVVSFNAGGLMQIAHHLLTWGDTVTVIEPGRLNEILIDLVETLQKHYLKSSKKQSLIKMKM